jgi:hypothetical protein
MSFQLAQLNIGIMKGPADSPVVAGFYAGLDEINALAESSSGFVWRLVGDGNNATDIVAYENPLKLVNMSVWSDLDSLAAFVYRSAHVGFMRRRKEWFEAMDTYMVLWWVPEGHRPTVDEAKDRLARLEADGPTPQAFTFKSPFPPPGTHQSVSPILDKCA